MPTTHVKICGITRLEDARVCLEAGADAIGLNFHPGSKRFVGEAAAAAIVASVGEQAITVGVFVDMSAAEIGRIKQATGIRCVQLHGSEPPELLERFLPHAFKALRVRGPQVAQEAERYGGEHVLLDAYRPGEPGGTGETFDWTIAAQLARGRHVTLAGGLTPDNVARAVSQVRPFCVDVASGVEAAPGIKDAHKVRAFISAAKG